MTAITHTARLEFAPGLSMAFPDKPCCNCGQDRELQQLHQDTRVTRYMFGGGSELVFDFVLPFCARCAPSARRRPRGLGAWLLTAVLAFAVIAAAIVGIGLATEIAWMAAYLVPIAVAGALLVCAGMVLLRRPQQGQTSFVQPVRIVGIKQEFVSGKVTQVRLAMTHKDFRWRAEALNREAIDRGLLVIRDA